MSVITILIFVMLLIKKPQLRIAVNSRCERQCFYCRPSGESLPINFNLSINQNHLIKICEIFKTLGIDEVKLTGGDPALWEPLVDCVYTLKKELKLKQVQIISRHPRIGTLTNQLASSGVDLINISLDTLNSKLYEKITGRNDLNELLLAIEEIIASGIKCKINTVVMNGINDKEINDIITFCEDKKIDELKLLDMIKDLDYGRESYVKRLKFILGDPGASLEKLYLPLDGFAKILANKSKNYETIYQGGLGHPMTLINLNSGLKVIVKDHQRGAWYGSICRKCKFYPCHDALMALRLTPDYRLQYCLLREDITADLGQYIISNDFQSLHHELKRALAIYETSTFITKNEVPHV